MNEFEEWFEDSQIYYTPEFRQKRVDMKSELHEAWNAALEEAHKQLPDLGGYEYAANVQDKFHDNIESIKTT